MNRTISIDLLSLHNMKLGEDHTTIKHDSTKMDKVCQNLVDKRCYANQKDPQSCLNTALGIWFCLEQDQFSTTELYFEIEGPKMELSPK